MPFKQRGECRCTRSAAHAAGVLPTSQRWVGVASWRAIMHGIRLGQALQLWLPTHHMTCARTIELFYARYPAQSRGTLCLHAWRCVGRAGLLQACGACARVRMRSACVQRAEVSPCRTPRARCHVVCAEPSPGKHSTWSRRLSVCVDGDDFCPARSCTPRAPSPRHAGICITSRCSLPTQQKGTRRARIARAEILL